MKMKILVDLSYLVHRCHHGASEAMSSRVHWRHDNPILTTSALVGGMHTLFSLLDYARKRGYTDTTLRDFILCDDAYPVFRELIYPGYKNRPKTEEQKREKDDILFCKNLLKHVAASIGCHVARSDKFQLRGKMVAGEADDVIGVLSNSYAQKHQRCTIYGNDLDLFQLIQPYVSIWRPSQEGITEFDQRNMASAHTIEISKERCYWDCANGSEVVLFKALLGDASDTYPGVPKFGPAKWPGALQIYRLTKVPVIQYLHNFELFESLMPPGKLRDDAESNFDTFKRCLVIATISLKIKVLSGIEFPAPDAVVKDIEYWGNKEGWGRIREMLKSYRCGALIARIDKYVETGK